MFIAEPRIVLLKIYLLINITTNDKLEYLDLGLINFFELIFNRYNYLESKDQSEIKITHSKIFEYIITQRINLRLFHTKWYSCLTY